ncbi:hypothetical protein WME90_12170 [Sorangium sp. So ce375]
MLGAACQAHRLARRASLAALGQEDIDGPELALELLVAGAAPALGEELL